MARTYYTNPDARRYTDGDEARARLNGIIAALEWHDIPCSDAPMMPALGIKEAIQGFGIPARMVAWNGLLARGRTAYGLYGIEGHYRNGIVRIYMLDRGGDMVPLCADEMLTVGLDLAPAVQ